MTRRLRMSIGLLLLTLGLLYPPFIAAQDVQIDPFADNPTSNQDNGQGGGTTDSTGNRGLSWWWLLPLLAIPLLFLLLPKRDDQDQSEYVDTSMAGTKGGRRKRDVDDEDDSVAM